MHDFGVRLDGIGLGFRLPGGCLGNLPKRAPVVKTNLRTPAPLSPPALAGKPLSMRSVHQRAMAPEAKVMIVIALSLAAVVSEESRTFVAFNAKLRVVFRQFH